MKDGDIYPTQRPEVQLQVKRQSGCFRLIVITLILIFVVMPITCTSIAAIGRVLKPEFDPALVEIQGNTVYYDGKHLMTPDDIIERKPTGHYLALCRTVGNHVAVKQPVKDDDIKVVIYPIKDGYMVEWIDFGSRQIYQRGDVGKITSIFHNQIDLRQP
jgi:hypothetical protein